MTEPSGADLYRTDRRDYVAAFLDLERRYDWPEDELSLVNGVGFFLSQDEYEGTADVVAMGYLAGYLEEWRSDELAEHRLSTIWRDVIEADMATKFDVDWDAPGWARIMFCVVHFHGQIDEFSFDRERLDERLGFLCDAVTDRMFTGGVPDETRAAWHMFHRWGTGLFLYTRWLMLMDENHVPEHERWTENAIARPTSDSLIAFDFPMRIRNCELHREDWVGGYEVRSKGAFGGVYWTRFRALGDTAQIIISMKEGSLGARPVQIPEPRHVEVLRDLGFRRMIWPDGRRYEFRAWPGIIRRVK